MVDDNNGVQTVLRRLLQRAGYDVLLAHGLEEALLQMRADEVVSLAVVDLNLEDVQGEFAVGSLRSVAPDPRSSPCPGASAPVRDCRVSWPTW